MAKRAALAQRSAVSCVTTDGATNSRGGYNAPSCSPFSLWTSIHSSKSLNVSGNSRSPSAASRSRSCSLRGCRCSRFSKVSLSIIQGCHVRPDAFQSSPACNAISMPAGSGSQAIRAGAGERRSRCKTASFHHDAENPGRYRAPSRSLFLLVAPVSAKNPLAWSTRTRYSRGSVAFP